MADRQRSSFTPVNSTPLGIRYVLLADVASDLRDECEAHARARRAVLILPDRSPAVFYEEWLEWRESRQASGDTYMDFK